MSPHLDQKGGMGVLHLRGKLVGPGQQPSFRRVVVGEPRHTVQHLGLGKVHNDMVWESEIHDGQLWNERISLSCTHAMGDQFHTFMNGYEWKRPPSVLW